MMKRVIVIMLVLSTLVSNNALANEKKTTKNNLVNQTKENGNQEYIVKSKNDNAMKKLKVKYKNKTSVNHKMSDEKYINNENITVLKLTKYDIESLKESSDYIVEKNYTVTGLSKSTSGALEEVPCTKEEFENRYDYEYSDDPTEFEPCEAVPDGSSSNETLPWNIEAVAGDPKTNEYTGNGVKVAVIDSGIDVHNDLNTEGWIDFSDKVNGYKPVDNSGHGTEMAGIIAARSNGIGTIGIAYNAEMYSVKILDSSNKASVSSVIKAIEWCIENDIDVINMSFGLDEDSEILHEYIRKAAGNNITIVVAAGNDNNVQYPAKYEEVISVGGVDKNLNIASYSPKDEYVDVYAPSEMAQTTGYVGTYTISSGTSIAAAHVTGVVAALKSKNTYLTYAQIKTIISESALEINEDETTAGLVNYQNAINMCNENAGNSETSVDTCNDVEIEDISQCTDNDDYVEGSWSKDNWQGKSRQEGTGHYTMINAMDTEYFAVGAANYTEKTHNRWIVADAAYRVDEYTEFKNWKGNDMVYKYPPYHANTHYNTTLLRHVVNFLYELSRQRLVNNLWFSFDPNSYNNKDEYKGIYIPVKIKKRIVSDMNIMNQGLKVQYANTSISMDKTSSQGYMIMGVLLHLLGDFYCHRAMVTKDMFFESDANGDFEYSFYFDRFGINCYDCRLNCEHFDGLDSNRGLVDYFRVCEYITENGGVPINRLKGKMRKKISITLNGKEYNNISAAAAFEDNPYFYSNRYSASCYVVNETLNDMKKKNNTTNLYGFLSWGVPIYENEFDYNFKNERWGYEDGEDE